MSKILKTFGTILISLVIILCIPVAIPQFAGFGVYNVISGSMEPTLSVGTLVYTRPANAYDLKEGDIIAFYAGNSVVTHRVVEVDSANLLYTTKGDANPSNDFEPVAYTNIIGTVQFQIPYLGYVAKYLSTLMGKLLAIFVIVWGLIMNFLGDRFKEIDNSKIDTNKYSEPQFQNAVKIKNNRRNRKANPKIVLISGILIIVISLGTALYIMNDYKQSNDLYADLNELYVEPVDKTEPVTPQKSWEDDITVDFESLSAINPDIVAWIYVEGTDISYPVMYSGDDEGYLHTSFDGTTSKAGCIFLEGANNPDFNDMHTLIYGHNMRNLSMFGSLKFFKSEDNYLEDHGYFQVITPTEKRRYQIFSYFDVAADSWVYIVPFEQDESYTTYISSLVRSSYVSTPTGLDITNKDKIITLSTCSSEDNRFVVNGVLVEQAGY